MITAPVYCTREDVKRALDVAETARRDEQVDRAITAASRTIEGLLHRRMYPQVDTRYWDWPAGSASWRLWLDDSELISVTSLSSGGTVIPSTDYLLEPNRSGPPYNRVEINLSTSSAFGGGPSHQRDITITGLYGYSNDESPAGLTAEAMTDTETDLDVTDSAAIGVGQILRIGTERLIVTSRRMLTTGQTLQTPMTVRKDDVTVAVTNGSAYSVGETLLLDAERMLVVDIAGNNLIVRRAWDGSVLAAHTGSTVYAARTLTVARGALGTAAAPMNSGDSIARWEPPAPVRDLCIAEALNRLLQETSGYVGTTGEGRGKRETSAVALTDLRDQAYTSHGRQARHRAV